MKIALIQYTLLLCMVSLLLTNQVSGQEKWKQGYVVTNSGDTLKGSIFYKHIQKSPKFIRFSNDNGTHSTEYTPLTLKLFSVFENKQNYVYRSYIMDLDNTPDDVAKVDTNKDPKMARDTIFAQLLVGGVINLLYYKDYRHGKEHYIVETSTTQATDLIDNSYYLDDTRQFFLKNEHYKKQLRELTQDCAEITIDGINKLRFNFKELEKIVSDYNRIKTQNEPSEYKFKQERIGWKFGVFFGCIMNSLQIGGVENISYANFPFHPGVEAGVCMDIVFPRSDNAFSLHNELGYAQFRAHSEAQNVHYSWNGNLEDIVVSSDYIRLLNTFRYCYPYNRYKPFIEFGIVNGLSMGVTQYFNLVNTFSHLADKSSIVTSVRSYEQSYCIGAGAFYKKLGIGLRYEKGNGFTGNSFIGTTTTRIHFLASYTF